MDYTSVLREFYDNEAEKFSRTRVKHWPEFEHILQNIQQYIETQEIDKVHIIELGCGDGRLARFLDQHIDTSFVYEGVDFAQGMIDIARTKTKKYVDQSTPSANDISFVSQDMLQYIKDIGQERVDIVVSVASIQHLMEYKKRLYLMNHLYRVLKYGGLHLSINRCCSQRFQQKYAGPLRRSLWKWMWTFGQWDRHDVLVPFQGEEGTVYQRPYHLYSQQEMQKITSRAGLQLETRTYIDKQGKQVPSPLDARNSFCVQKKSVFE